MSAAMASPQINPFPGLRPFREDEEHLFFGRENQVDAMVNKLADTRFLAVVGTSGSGKSSLVNCGLRPALRQGLMARAGTAWRMAQFRPGNDPIAAMARELAKDGVLFREHTAAGLTLAEVIETTLHMSKVGLIDIYEQAGLDEGVNLLVVVDQFEELFRYRQLGETGRRAGESTGDEAAAFVNLLLEVKERPTCPIFVVLTMRSDFLGDCTQFPGLAEAINAGQYLVPRMTRDERRAAIEGPVGVGGAEIAPVLLTRLVNDVGDNPDQLSILQHALNRTWALWQNEGGKGPLDLAHYEAIGTMAHALDKHAEQAYAELGTTQQQQICEKLFKALTDKANDARGVRRPTTLGKLCALADATAAEVADVIGVFRDPSRSFLMPPAGEALGVETVIDISHESLMRVWQRLIKWTDEEVDSAQIYRRLVDTADLHAAGNASLWRDPELQLALDWREKSKPNEAWAQRYGDAFGLAMDFIRKSERYRFRRRALVIVAVGLPVMLVAVALLLGIYVTSDILAALPYQNPAEEFSDFGIAQQTELKQGSLATSTPTGIPRGRVISTLDLKLAISRHSIEGSPFLLINALDADLGRTHIIPNSLPIPYAGHSGGFHDDTQRKLESELKKQTANNPEMPLVFYCSGSHCWESYNACLRAINLGYKRVYWYRGGINAWFGIHTFDVKDLDLTRIEVKAPTILANTPEMLKIMGQVIVRVFKSEILGDHSETLALESLIADASNNRGLEHSRNRDYDYAIRDYDQAIKLDPENPQFYLNRGDAYYFKREYDNAIKDYDKTIALDPRDAMAYFDRGYAYFGKREYNHAIENYDQAIELSPEFTLAYAGRAKVHFDKGDYGRAIQDYGEAINLDSKNPEYYTSRGAAYFARGDYDRVIEDVNQSIQNDPKDGLAYFYRALAQLYSDKADLAVSDFLATVRRAPYSHAAVTWLHIARMRAGSSDLQALSRNAQKLDRAKWPWHVVGLFLGSSSPDVVRAAAEVADSPDTHRMQVCQADFYLGIYRQEMGARDDARRLFQSVKEACPPDLVEYAAAIHELERLR